MPELTASTLVFDDVWLGARLGPTAMRVTDGRLMPLPQSRPPDGVRRLSMTLMPGVIDHHVHLGLVDRSRLANGPLVEVHDLGWGLDAALQWRADPPPGVNVRVAGPFHTAAGGYPSGREWAPAQAVRAVTDPGDARRAVADAATAGVDAIKIALQTEMPLLTDELLRELVGAAHRTGLPAIVHAEGVGQAARAIAAGADVLVHAPWSERLDDTTLRQALKTTWISTLAIHEGESRATAIENLRRFRALGGRIKYGTDMGNGEVPVGPSEAELTALEQAGLDVDGLMASMTAGVPSHHAIEASRALVCERPLPSSAAELAAWLANCRRLDASELQEAR